MGPLPRLVREMAGEHALSRILRRAELPAAILDNPKLRLPVADLARLFDFAAQAVGDEAFGLRVGRHMPASDYGAFVLYALAAPSLGRALARLVRSIAYYQQPDCLVVEPSGSLVRFCYRTPLQAARFGRHHSDHVLGPMLDFVRAYLGPSWLPLVIDVPYDRGDHQGALDSIFGVPVRWSQRGTALLFSRELMATPHGTAPAKPLSIGELRDLVERSRRVTVRSLVAEIVALRLQDGLVDLDGAARKLGLHRRGLQRALALEGTTYREVTERVLHRVAEQELAAGVRTIAEIAMGLGYSEPQHFTRAFRRWTGLPPSAYRPPTPEIRPADATA